MPFLIKFSFNVPHSYEGTGRSLSLKLIQQLREQGNKLPTNGSSDGGPVSGNTWKHILL